MIVNFRKNRLTLNSDGSIFWAKEKTLILGDLHLEKSTFFGPYGNYLPPYDSLETLLKLTNSINNNTVETIILLGDIFHDANGYSRLKNKERKIFDFICKKNKIIWILGNHDNGFAPDNVHSCRTYKMNNITFSHILTKGINFEISGHYHPKVSFFYRRQKITRPCFLYSKNKIILPSYGTYTGGLNIESKVYKKIFDKDYKAYALGNKNVISVEDYMFS